jgi:hypothetical protein
MLLFLGTFDVRRRDWKALRRRMRLLRLGNKRQKMQVLRVKWQKPIELRKMEQYNPPLSATAHFANKNAAICAVLLLLPNYHLFKLIQSVILRRSSRFERARPEVPNIESRCTQLKLGHPASLGGGSIQAVPVPSERLAGEERCFESFAMHVGQGRVQQSQTPQP